MRAQFGMFYLYPASATISINSTQTVTVECLTENPGRCEEMLAIEVSDRAPSEPPIYYKLSGEVVIPGFVTQDMNTIFEEHLIVANSDVLTLSKGPNVSFLKLLILSLLTEPKKAQFKIIVSYIGKLYIIRITQSLTLSAPQCRLCVDLGLYL